MNTRDRLVGTAVLLGACTLIAGGVRAQGTNPPVPNSAAVKPDAPPKAMPAPPDAYVYIGWPNDGEVVRISALRPHIKVWFGARNIGIAPAGTSKPNTGHHHLLIDVPLPPLDEPIPNDKNHLHFGLGQTETFIDLPPGPHTLQLLMADGNHVPHDPPLMSKKITIYVQGSVKPPNAATQ
jgi:hypothetical protein